MNKTRDNSQSPFRGILERITRLLSALEKFPPFPQKDEWTRELTELESDVRTAETQIETETEKMNAILSAMGESLVAIDAEYRVVLMNQAATVMLRIALADALGKDIHEIMPLFKGETRLEKEFSPIAKAIRERSIVTVRLVDDLYTQNKAGGRFPITISAAALSSARDIGGISGIVMIRDVSTEKAVDRAKTEFVSLASHQLRTPLSTIGWYAEMLLSGDAGELKPEQQKYLEEVYKGNRRMVDLVNALLNVSRIELGTFGVEPEPTNLVPIAESVLEELAHDISRKKLSIRKVFDSTLPLISVDPKLVRIVFQNLLSNAVKYTSDGGTITVTVSHDDEAAHISVADSGYGIPQAEQSRIFTKLFRADNAREKETDGTGLGLYITKSIVERTGGRIWFESAGENKGTIFYVLLPRSGMRAIKGTTELAPVIA